MKIYSFYYDHSVWKCSLVIHVCDRTDTLIRCVFSSHLKQIGVDIRCIIYWYLFYNVALNGVFKIALNYCHNSRCLLSVWMHGLLQFLMSLLFSLLLTLTYSLCSALFPSVVWVAISTCLKSATLFCVSKNGFHTNNFSSNN